VTKPNITTTISQWDLQKTFGIKSTELNKSQVYLITYLYMQTLDLKVPTLEISKLPQEDSFTDDEEPKIIVK